MSRSPLFETERLYAALLTPEDRSLMCEQLQDPQVMYAYEGAFDDAMVDAWLMKMLRRYEEEGCALYALRRKGDGVFVGQCGITLQQVEGRVLHEVGYLLSKRFWHQGYATEAARAARDFAFESLNAPLVCATIRVSNTASEKVALRIGLKEELTFVKHYRGLVMPHKLYTLSREEWLSLGSLSR